MNMQMIWPLTGIVMAVALLLLAAVGAVFGSGQTSPALLLGGLAAFLLVFSLRSWPSSPQ